MPLGFSLESGVRAALEVLSVLCSKKRGSGCGMHVNSAPGEFRFTSTHAESACHRSSWFQLLEAYLGQAIVLG